MANRSKRREIRRSDVAGSCRGRRVPQSASPPPARRARESHSVDPGHPPPPDGAPAGHRTSRGGLQLHARSPISAPRSVSRRSFCQRTARAARARGAARAAVTCSSRHLVGLLTHGLGRPRTFSPGSRVRDGGNGWNAIDLSRPPCPGSEHGRTTRPNTAAGPSRNRTGVPCLPKDRSGEPPATSVAGECSGCHEVVNHADTATPRPHALPPAAGDPADHEVWSGPQRETVTVVPARPAPLAQAGSAARSTQRARANHCRKNTSDSLKPLSQSRR
jgi:hypothetical protein